MKRYQKANEGIHAPEEVKEKAVRPSGRQGYTKWVGAVAAVLAVAVIGGIAAWPGQTHGPAPVSNDDPGVPAPFSGEEPVEPRTIPGDAENYGGGTHQAHALSLAAYPKMVQFPIQEDYMDASGSFDSNKYYDEWDKWRDSRRAFAINGDFTGRIDGFLTDSTAQFLSGSGEENRVYSPLNVYLALSMLAETAGGDSRQQLLDLLEVDSIESLRSQAQALWLGNYRDDGVVTSILANSLWLRDDMTYSMETLKTLAEQYYASSFSGAMGSEEYDQALRDWIDEQTHGLLREQSGELKLSPETALALASTVYFKAAWDDQFFAANTVPMTFHAPAGDVETDFMRKTMGSMEDVYYWGEHFAAVSLRFREGGEMWLILPDEGYSVDGLLESGEAMEFLLADKYGLYNEETDEFEGAWPGQKRLTVHLSMPKFDVSSDLDLIGGLQALGVTDVFDWTVSNFDPLGTSTDDPLYVAQAKHAAWVKVDEKGCEAAAYTIIDVPTGAAPPPDEEVEFTLDRPFLFAITGDSGLPLFTGVVNQPNG